jgi:hypothetical protein
MDAKKKPLPYKAWIAQGKRLFAGQKQAGSGS